MNLESTNKILAKRTRNFLDIGFFNGNKKRVIFNKYQADTNLKKVLLNVFESYSVPEIFIDVYAPNGSSYKFDQTVKITKDMMGYEQPTSLAGIPATPGAANDAFFQYVIREKDEKIREAKEQLLEMKDQHKLDIDTIRELREKNIELERENKFKEKEFELQRYEENLTDRENQKRGFEGVVDTTVNKISEIASNPQLMEIAKLWMSAKMGQQVGAAQAQTVSNKPAIKEMAQWMDTLDDATLQKVFAVINHFATQPASIDQVVGQLMNQ